MCCRKTAVCNGDQLLEFSVPELVRSQSTFSTDPEVLQNCAGFTMCSSAGLAVGKCSAVMDLTPCMLCVQTREAQRGKCNERSLPYHVICENRMLR